MPSGRVRWFDANKGYGFIINEEGDDVFMSASALPKGVTTLRKGAKVEYSVVERPQGAAGHERASDRLRAVPGQGHPPEAR